MPPKPSSNRPATTAERPAAEADFHVRFAAAMRAARACGARWPMAVAVSGGGDSLAQMVLLAEWAAAERLSAPHVLTVDHGLYADSRAQAKIVCETARSFGLSCAVLRWSGPAPDSDIEATARKARYRLMGRWCADHDIATLCLAHTQDDQAETFLLRLARGSGVDGLSAMAPVAPFPDMDFPGLTIARPLLGFGRTELRAFLTARALAWTDDPMNADVRFARVRLRRIMPQLEAAGLSAARIASACAHLRRARDALEGQTGRLLAAAARPAGDRFALDGAALVAAPREVGLRALAQLLMTVSGRTYRPRFGRLEPLFDLIVDGRLRARTLHGCRVFRAPKGLAAFGPATILLAREPPRSRSRASKKEKGDFDGY